MPPTFTLRRGELVRLAACAEWLAFFDAVCAERGTGVDELTIEASPLVQVWLSLPLSPGSGTAWAWLRQHGFVDGAYLTGADLAGAYLTGARRLATDALVKGWVTRYGRMERALSTTPR